MTLPTVGGITSLEAGGEDSAGVGTSPTGNSGVHKFDVGVHFTKDAHSRPSVNIDASKQFHVWAMQWQEGQIDWYLDGKVINTYKGPTPQEKMFILIALFQYSGWIGNIDPNMTYPRDFEVDYVRVYARDAK